MIIEIIGWIGSILVIFAYAMNIFKKISSDSTAYYALNIAGSASLIVNTIYHHSMPSAAVNIVWIMIAIAGLIKKKAF